MSKETENLDWYYMQKKMQFSISPPGGTLYLNNSKQLHTWISLSS